MAVETLLPLALRALAGVQPRLHGMMVRVELLLAVAVFAVAGLGFLVAAGYLALQAQVGAIAAAAIVGAALLAIAGALALVAVRRRSAPPPAAGVEVILTEAARHFGVHAGAQLDETVAKVREAVAKDPVPMTLVALIVGVVAGLSRRR